MDTKPYHHGNLRNELIETGISYINENGSNQFSLRKVAAACGVSHTAPYSHFKDKDDLLDAMKNHVSERFAESLQDVVDKNEGQEIIPSICELGEAYVKFFHENPKYYEFVFERADFDIDLDDVNTASNYRPFEVFRCAVIKMFEIKNVPVQLHKQTLIKMWALVHGLAGISIMRGIKFTEQWPSFTKQLLFDVFNGEV